MLMLVAGSLLTFLVAVVPASAAGVPAKIQQLRPAGAPPLTIAAYDKIDAAIQKKGTSRVIVRLVAPSTLEGGFALEGTLKSSESIRKQRTHIAHLQNNVVALLSKAHGAVAKRFNFIPFMAMEVDSAEFNALAASGDIDLIEEDIPVPPTLMDSVPLIGGVNGTFSGYSGTGQTVAILDTGVDKTHPFLAGKVVAEACFSTTDSVSSVTAVCQDGSTSPGSGANCSSNLEGCDHGTHVAGIVAGKGDTFAGVAQDATLIAIQVFSQFPPLSCDSGTACVMSFTSDQISGLQHVYDLRNTYNISSVNMSLGGGSYTTNCDADNAGEKAAIDTLRSVGIATVIASGNDSSTDAISAPACISSAISVGATDKSDAIAYYSNSASILNLLAPGSSIYSSVPGGGYAYFSGTSMATPHVAGAWAVLKSAQPAASVSDVLTTLTTTGKNITDTRNSITKPRIQLDIAVNSLIGAPINGACGASQGQAFDLAPSSDLCAFYSSASAVIGSDPWRWSCRGVNGGITANCLAYTSAHQADVLFQNFDSVPVSSIPPGWGSSGTYDSFSGLTSMWQTNAGTRYPPGIGSHSPTNLIYFNSWDVDNGITALLSSPAFSLTGTSGGKVGFWMYHDSQYSNADKVDVYVNTVPTLGGATRIGSEYRYNGSDGWYQHSFDIPDTFTGSTNYLLINGVGDYGNDIHLDDISVSAFSPAYYKVNFTFAGNGYGAVNSVPSDLSCTGTSGSGCASSYFAGGSTVTLTAVADASSSHYSVFSGWTTDAAVCPDTGPCALTMNGPVNVTGTFSWDKLVRISPTGVTYGTILEALAAAAPGQTIQIRDNSGLVPFADALVIGKSISLKGGFAPGFGANTGYTTTNGKLTIGNGGTLRADRIRIMVSP